MATTVLGLKTFVESDPVDYNEINDNYNKIDSGVKTALQGRAVHNWLDNSDFRNPVNQRGASSYKLDSGYTIDRWKLHWTGDGNITLHDGYISLYRKTYQAYMFQFFENIDQMVGKTYTVAAKVRYNGRIGWIDSTQRTNTGMVHLSDWAVITHTFTVSSATSEIGSAGVEITTDADLSFELQWIALYEGAYTADTLPDYVPKGYAADLAECKLHYRIMQTPCIPCANNPAGNQVYGYIQGTMRIAPTVICDNLFYFQGDGTYTQVTGATAALAGDGIRIVFDLAQNVNGNLAGVVGGTAITFDANM